MAQSSAEMAGVLGCAALLAFGPTAAAAAALAAVEAIFSWCWDVDVAVQAAAAEELSSGWGGGPQ